MSSRNPCPPFPPGSFLLGTLDAGVTLNYTQYEGMEFVMEDFPTGNIVTPRQKTSARLRTMRIVRSMGSAAVLPSQLQIPSLVTAFEGKRTTGPQTAAGFSFVADPGLRTAGAPQYSLYWIVVSGPTTVLDSGGTVTVGNGVIATTTSGTATTVADSAITAAQLAYRIGRCTSSLVSGKFGVDVFGQSGNNG